MEVGRGSSVGIATRYGLDGPGIESRWGARFSAPVHTGPGAHPASCTMDTGSFPGVKRPGRGADHPPPSKCRCHERVELYLYSPSGLQWPVIGRTLPLPVPLLSGAVFAEKLAFPQLVKKCPLNFAQPEASPSCSEPACFYYPKRD